MPIYLRANDAITAYGDGCGNIVIRQLSAKDNAFVGEVCLTLDQFEMVLDSSKRLQDEALHGSADLDELEAQRS